MSGSDNEEGIELEEIADDDLGIAAMFARAEDEARKVAEEEAKRNLPIEPFDAEDMKDGSIKFTSRTITNALLMVNHHKTGHGAETQRTGKYTFIPPMKVKKNGEKTLTYQLYGEDDQPIAGKTVEIKIDSNGDRIGVILGKEVEAVVIPPVYHTDRDGNIPGKSTDPAQKKKAQVRQAGIFVIGTKAYATTDTTKHAMSGNAPKQAPECPVTRSDESKLTSRPKKDLDVLLDRRGLAAKASEIGASALAQGTPPKGTPPKETPPLPPRGHGAGGLAR